jgi:hypothetical protein
MIIVMSPEHYLSVAVSYVYSPWISSLGVRQKHQRQKPRDKKKQQQKPQIFLYFKIIYLIF